MSITKLFLSVSVIAMFAVGSAWATDPKNTSDTDDTVATSHSADIYPSALEPITTAEGIAGAVSQFKDSGIAGVTYVNRMVGVAGGAAQQAEDHAAAAGASAIAAQTAADEAKESADEAKSALNDKFDNTSTVKNAIVTTDANGKVAPVQIVDKGTGTYVTDVVVNAGTVTLSRGTPKVSELENDSDYATMSAVNAKLTKAQGSTNANKAVITDASGDIITGTIATDMITDGAVTSAKIADGTVDLADLASNSVNSAKIVDASVAAADLASNSVTTAKITDLNVTTAKIAASAVTTAKIADSAVTAAKTSGVIGSIPSGSATSTTYATIWVE